MRNFTQLPAGTRFNTASHSMVSGLRNGHDVFLQWADFVRSLDDDTTHKLAVEGGAGIVGIAEAYRTGVMQFGDGLIKTEIYIDVTGLTSAATDDDIIGDEGTGAAHLGQITAARNGTIYKGQMSCMETPLTGDDDIALWSATAATGVEDTLITALAGDAELVQSQGDSTPWVAGDEIALAALPAADTYLYLVVDGTGTAGTYTAGKFMIELWGY